MIGAFILYAILVGWAAKDGDLYFKEIAIYGVIWLVLLAGFIGSNFYATGFGFWFVVPTCLMDIYLLLKLVGNPSASG